MPYRTEGDNQGVGAVEGSVVLMACLDSWAATAVPCLVGGELRRRHPRKLYVDTTRVKLRLAKAQLKQNIREFVNYWEPHELVVATVVKLLN